MNDKFKNYLHENFDGIMFAVLCVIIVSVFVCLCPIKYNNNVGGTVQQVKQDVDATGTDIKQAQVANREAGDALERANSSIRNSRERVRELQTELRLINAELERCLTLNQQAQNELKSIRGSNN